jgi:hypothetical protein
MTLLIEQSSTSADRADIDAEEQMRHQLEPRSAVLI